MRWMAARAFIADLVVCLNRTLFATNAFASQLLARLRHTKLIGGEFGRVHAIHQVVFGGNSLPQPDYLIAKTAVQTFVVSVVKDTEVLTLNARLPSGSGQHLEFFRCLLTKLQSFEVRSLLIGQLLPSRFNGEILLGQRDFRLSRIAVLGNQVSRETRQLKVKDFPLPALANRDHFLRAQNDAPARFQTARKKLWPSGWLPQSVAIACNRVTAASHDRSRIRLRADWLASVIQKTGRQLPASFRTCGRPFQTGFLTG